jgi:hypothetical protein
MSDENVLEPENVLLFASNVEEAAVMVLLSPKLNAVPLIVTDEFCSALLGKLSDELAIWYSAPLFAPMKPVRVASTGVLVNVCVPPHVFDVEVPKARDTVFTERVNGYEKVRGFSYVPKSDTCDLVIERLGSAVIDAIDDVAERFAMKVLVARAEVKYWFVRPSARASVVVAWKNE